MKRNEVTIFTILKAMRDQISITDDIIHLVTDLSEEKATELTSVDLAIKKEEELKDALSKKHTKELADQAAELERLKGEVASLKHLKYTAESEATIYRDRYVLLENAIVDMLEKRTGALPSENPTVNNNRGLFFLIEATRSMSEDYKTAEEAAKIINKHKATATKLRREKGKILELLNESLKKGTSIAVDYVLRDYKQYLKNQRKKPKLKDHERGDM
jgi:chromosome segregation ATPase